MKIPKSYDIVGDILILEIRKEQKKDEKKIAKALLKRHPHLKVIVKKASEHKGKLRKQKYKVIAGENRKETIYKENNALMKLNIQDTYFTPRLASERLRIAKQIKKPESVLVMFSGVAPYPLVIAKNSKAKEIYAVELNKKAHEYAKKNLVLNKIDNIHLFQGDVAKIVPKLDKKFDRIIMPLPKEAHKYLKIAFRALKNKGMIHLYTFAEEKDIEKIKNKYKQFQIKKIIKCGSYSPRTYRLCVDMKL